MKQRTRALTILFILILLASLPGGPARSASTATTPVCADITTTTWTVAGSPYEVCDTQQVTIPAGNTLTIQAGVTVEFDGSAYPFMVNGSLVAQGTDTANITITGTSGGLWRGIYLSGMSTSNANLTLTNTTISNGGVAQQAEIYAYQYAAIAIDHSIIQNSQSAGLLANNYWTVTVQSTSFTNNATDALNLVAPTGDLNLTGLTASGNGVNAVRLTGTNPVVSGQRHWTNPGIPYRVDPIIINNAGDTLTLDPGSELDFNTAGGMSIGGELLAQGASDQPIVFTGLTKSPGAWRGIQVLGGSQPALAQLDYVTLEYGGSVGANVEVMNGQLIAHNSIFRYSLKDGIKFDSGFRGSLLDSQVYGNGNLGIESLDTTRAIQASNNWWGTASGPQNATCNPTGTGDKVSNGVLFLPFALAQGATQPLPLSAYPSITLTPRKWYAAADGADTIYFDITVRDGNGVPLPGYVVQLSQSPALGTVKDGGVTGLDGTTLASITSVNSGNVAVTAHLATNTCVYALSPEADVTFTQPVNVTDLFPNSPAPYINDGITVTPQPVIQGVQETVTVHLTNPLPQPISVDVQLSWAQAGVGLQFGPIGEINPLAIPAGGTVPVTMQVTPPISGHYCIQVAFTILSVGASAVLAPTAQKQLKWFNWNPQPAGTGSQNKTNELYKTRQSLDVMNFFASATGGKHLKVPLKVVNAGIDWDLNNAEKISRALQGDPPRQDYNQITLPVVLQLPPVSPGNDLSPAMAAAMNDLDSALAQADAYGTAAAIAFDREGGAAAAGDMTWESTQAGVLLYYNKDFGQALITASKKITALLAVAASEGYTSAVLTVDDATQFQAYLQVNGFDTEDITAAHALGMSDADIAAVLANILAARPQDVAGDMVARMADLSTQFANLGNALVNPQVFAPSYSVSGAAGHAQQAGNNVMAQVYNSTATFQVGNPTGAQATVNLAVRRIDLPADWSVTVSPQNVILAAGATTSVTVTILAGSPVPWGSRPRVALEGSINGALIGGVVVDVYVPVYAPFDGKLHVYLPAVMQ